MLSYAWLASYNYVVLPRTHMSAQYSTVYQPLYLHVYIAGKGLSSHRTQHSNKVVCSCECMWTESAYVARAQDR